MERLTRQPETFNEKLLLQSVQSLGRHYGLLKRIFVPSWWLLGYIAKFGQRESYYSHLVSRLKGFKLLVGPSLPGCYAGIIFSVWHELIQQYTLCDNPSSHEITVPLSRILRGTPTEISDIIDFLELYWSDTFKVYKVQEGLKEKKSSHFKNCGNLHPIAMAKICPDSLTLTLKFSISVTDFIFGKPFLDSESLCEVPVCISLNPDLLMCSAKTLKPLLPYLYMEASKGFRFDSVEESQSWFSRPVEGKAIPLLHREMQQKTNRYYDHGILGWKESPPRQSISQLKKKQKSSGSLFFCWNLSDTCSVASKMEQGLTHVLLEQAGHQLSESQEKPRPRLRLQALSPEESLLSPAPKEEQSSEQKKADLSSPKEDQPKPSPVQRDVNKNKVPQPPPVLAETKSVPQKSESVDMKKKKEEGGQAAKRSSDKAASLQKQRRFKRRLTVSLQKKLQGVGSASPGAAEPQKARSEETQKGFVGIPAAASCSGKGSHINLCQSAEASRRSVQDLVSPPSFSTLPALDRHVVPASYEASPGSSEEAVNHSPRSSIPAPRMANLFPEEDEGHGLDFNTRLNKLYATLTPAQKQRLERKRKSMDPSDFKDYVMPILLSMDQVRH